MFGGSLNRNGITYGGWTLCEPISRGADVLSVGIGGDITFDVKVARKHKANVRCFDPTISQKDFEKMVTRYGASEGKLRFLPFGLGGINAVLPFYRMQNRTFRGSLTATPNLKGYDKTPYLHAPILRMPNLISLVQPFAPEIVKLDIEGAEWGLFAETDAEMRRWLARGPVRQIAIEFHDRYLPGRAEKRAARHRVVQLLKRCGFHKRHQTPKSGEEVLFVRTRAVGAC